MPTGYRYGTRFGKRLLDQVKARLIIGAQTKPTVRVPGEWIDDIVSSAKGAGVAVFLKNSLRYLVDDEHFKFELLQEFPRSEAQDREGVSK